MMHTATAIASAIPVAPPSAQKPRVSYRLKELSQLSGMSVDKLKDLIRANKLSAKRAGHRTVLVPAESYAAYLASLPNA